MLDKEPLSQHARTVLAYIKETGTTGIAVLMVGFDLGQAAGWIPNVDRLDHKIVLDESRAQTQMLQTNQELLKEVVRQARLNQIAFVQLARGICISVTKTSEIERRCLSTDQP
jgi:ABC-type Mn2+/Zn2+ transport system ATPase subunit